MSALDMTGGPGRWWSREGIDVQDRMPMDLDELLNTLPWHDGGPVLSGSHLEVGMLATPLAVLRATFRVVRWRESASRPLTLVTLPRPVPGLLLGLGTDWAGCPVRLYALVAATFAPSITVVAHDVPDESGRWPGT